MKNKLHLVHNPVFLTCHWEPTGDPKMPLARVWTTPKHFQSASTASTTDETGRMPPVRLAEARFEAMATPAGGCASSGHNGSPLLAKACPHLSHGLQPRPDRDGARERCRSGVLGKFLRRQEAVNPFGQPICSVSDSSNALIPFQAICTPIQTRKKDDNCVITVIPVAPRIRANRSANP